MQVLPVPRHCAITVLVLPGVVGTAVVDEDVGSGVVEEVVVISDVVSSAIAAPQTQNASPASSRRCQSQTSR